MINYYDVRLLRQGLVMTSQIRLHMTNIRVITFVPTYMAVTKREIFFAHFRYIAEIVT